MNPELRQTLNTISRNFESANEAAQENIYTFTQLVIDPCVNGFKTVIADCASTCFPRREDRIRRRRARSRGRSDLHFDFYDDWEDEEDDGYGAASWGNDELDSLLAGRGTVARQPARQRTMSYGTRNRRPAHAPNEEDPNLIPSSSYLGFLERFKWRPGAKGLRYKPSAADLQEHPGALGREVEPLMEESEDDERLVNIQRHKRQRSDTQNSRSTTNSLSSRGDLIMGDEEDDAQPLDDEFAVMLTKQATNTSKRPGTSRKSTRSTSGKSNKSILSRRSDSSRSIKQSKQHSALQTADIVAPALSHVHDADDEQTPVSAQTSEVSLRAVRETHLPPKGEHEKETAPAPDGRLSLPIDALVDKLSDQGDLEMEQHNRTVSPIFGGAGHNIDSETEPFPSFPVTPTSESRENEQPP